MASGKLAKYLISKNQHPEANRRKAGELPPASVTVGLLAWLRAGVDSQQDTQDSCVGKITQTLHGERKHHLHSTCMSTTLQLQIADAAGQA